MNFALKLSPKPAVAQTSSPSNSLSSGDTRLRRLTDAAQQFEGMLLEELLKPMREHSFGSGDSDNSSGDNPDSSDFADTLSSYGCESLATAISRSGGLGIAKQVIQQMEGELAGHARR